MFFLTSESQELCNTAYIYPFNEEFDAEFEGYLYEQLARYSEILPQKFRSGIAEQTLFQHNKLMKEFEEWCYNTMEQFTTKSNAIHEKRDAITASFHPSAQPIFQQSLHDGKILHAEQLGNNFRLLLDMRGGFTVESIVLLVFQDARTEGTLEGYYIYDELIETAGAFALRVLSSFGSPYAEWTIFFKDVIAKYLYRPVVYIEPGEVTTWDEYMAALNHDYTYYIVKEADFVEIDLTQFCQNEQGIYAGEEWLGGTFEEARERIYCDIYEDPYAHLSEPISKDELSSAIFLGNQTTQVRAFNTIFALGEEVANIVNNILRKADKTSDENMYFSIIASHFDQLGCLEEDVKMKWMRE